MFLKPLHTAFNEFLDALIARSFKELKLRLKLLLEFFDQRHLEPRRDQRFADPFASERFDSAPRLARDRFGVGPHPVRNFDFRKHREINHHRLVRKQRPEFFEELTWDAAAPVELRALGDRQVCDIEFLERIAFPIFGEKHFPILPSEVAPLSKIVG